MYAYENYIQLTYVPKINLETRSFAAYIILVSSNIYIFSFWKKGMCNRKYEDR